MSRRRLVVIASACVLLLIGVLAGLVVVSLTQTQYGRDKVRGYLTSRITGKVKGRMYVGRISGGFLTGVTIDSIEIRDDEDSLFIASGPITVRYDPRDLIDKRILLSHLEIVRPHIVLRQHVGGQWNFRRIFPPGPPRRRSRETQGFGDFIVADSVTLRGTRVTLSMPWQPDDSLTGARRDSAIAFNLARTDRRIRRTGEGFARTWRWTDGEVALSHARLTHPDSTGIVLRVADLAVAESDPPFLFRNVAGTVTIRGDSAWMNFDRFALPGSHGSAQGKVVWGSGLPTRYDLSIVADTVSLADIAWVYPTLPLTGGGRMHLAIRNDARNLRVIDYALSRMDVRTTGSRLRGAMTFAVGGPVLALKDVDMAADPVDFELLRALNGRPFPVDWAGTIAGTLKARGGPLNRFRVDDAHLIFRDANVPGAYARATARGELDVLFPAFTVFRGLAVDVEHMDLATIEHLYPNFPRLGGSIAGRAVLDSSWLDVRFRNADITHTNGPDPASRLTGLGRVTWGERFMAYDLDVIAEALSFSSLARAYPALPLRGVHTGPIRAIGTVEDLAVTATLNGPGGAMSVDGRFDLFAPVFAARGKGTVAGLDVRALLDRPELPPTRLSAIVETDLAGDSLSDLIGVFSVRLDRSMVDGVRIYDNSMLRGRFDRGVVRVDTLALETAAASFSANGALGVAHGRRDSLRVRVNVDSLGGLRRWLTSQAPPSLVRASAGVGSPVPMAPAPDSLTGSILLAGIVAGAVDSLDVVGELTGDELYVRGNSASALRASMTLAGFRPGSRLFGGASATLAVDSLRVVGVALSEARAEVQLEDALTGRFAITARSETGPSAAVLGQMRRDGDSTFVRLDSVALDVGTGRYRLEWPVGLLLYSRGVSLDSLLLRHERTGWIAARALLPRDGDIDVYVATDSLSLADLGLLAQSELPLRGRLQGDWRVRGTRLAPEMQGRALVTNAQFGGMQVERAVATAGYRERWLDGALELFRGGQRAISARGRLPLDLSIAPVRERLLPDSLRGNIRTDSVDLAIIETLSPALQRATGALEANVDLSGTWQAPHLVGRLTVTDGAVGLANAGIRLRRLDADIGLIGDSVAIRRLSAQSGEARADTMSLAGWLSFDRGYDDPRFDLTLRARDFHIVDRPSVADLDVSTSHGNPPRLVGSRFGGAVLTGALSVERGSIFIPELIEKNVIDLSQDLADVVDTTLSRQRGLLPKAPDRLVQELVARDVSVHIGDDVWLRSAEANIQLGGDLEIARSRADREDGRAQLALAGTLNAVRGTYRLNLGIVTPSFQVERGTLRFFGDPDLNPTLDIAALHVVRQPAQSNRPDVRIRVTIGGTLAQPILELSSADSPPLPQSDLLSYLVTGQPAFALGGTGDDYAGTLGTVGIRWAGSYLSSLASGKVVDVVQIQTTGVSGSDTKQLLGGGLGVLSTTRVGIGWQLSDRTFLSASTGLCSLNRLRNESVTMAQDMGLVDELGAKVEHRFNYGFSGEIGMEPSTGALSCARSAARGLQQTPRQLGLDFFKTWKF